jgi:hypothetical protein
MLRAIASAPIITIMASRNRLQTASLMVSTRLAPAVATPMR